MNRLIITSIVFLTLCSTKIFAQEFHGMAVYESKTNLKDMKIESKDINDEMNKMIMESMKKQFEKKYFLDFNKSESVYYEEQKLETPTPSTSGFSMSFSSSSGGGEKTYKNVKEKQQIAEQDFFGKEFLVTDSLKNWKWQLKDETKKIGNYTCYKAIHVDPVTPEDIKQYEDFKKQQETSKTTFFIMDEPKERITTVWYSPEIPVSQGPGEFWGLPGLIMEANYDNTTILCSKIVLNPKTKNEIKKPKKGKKVTKKEYESLIEKQMEQMKDENGAIRIEIQK
ncbi:GLPGLI family protein [Flavobacterium sp. PLA-1-15]|uniref:GLPGLI family protein n=1 Tax=Flavobacterium sp. PLA-1-15 TaxID=3380533 RepID=UPI003B7E91B9